MLVNDHDEVEQRRIAVAYDSGNVAVIAKGLSAGERVITEGVNKVPPRHQGRCRRGQPRPGLCGPGRHGTGPRSPGRYARSKGRLIMLSDVFIEHPIKAGGRHLDRADHRRPDRGHRDAGRALSRNRAAGRAGAHGLSRAGAEVVEQAVAQVIETQVVGVDDMIYMSSKSGSGRHLYSGYFL